MCLSLLSSHHLAFLEEHPEAARSFDADFKPRALGLANVEDVYNHYVDLGQLPFIIHANVVDPRGFDLVNGRRQIEPRHPQLDEKNRFV